MTTLGSAFRYRASTPDGRLVDGVLRAPSRHSALEELRRQSLYAVDVEEVAASAGKTATRLSLTTAVASWARTMAALLGAGVAIDRALGFSAEHAQNAALARALGNVRHAVEGGLSLGEALGRQPAVFGPLVVAMVGAGEESGALDRTMARLADHLDQTEEMRAQARSALLYPALMAIAAGLGVTVLLLFVVPRFVGMLAEVGGTLPLSTRLLVGASHALIGWWWLWMFAGVIAVFGVRQWLAVPANLRTWHAQRLRLPIVGSLEWRFATASFVRTLGTLLQSGMSIVPALRVARSTVLNRALGERIERGAAAVGRGERIAAAFSDALPPLATQMLAVGEETGQLDALCLRVADSYDVEVRRALRSAISLIEPVMILVFGALVGFIALAMLQAIYSINAGGL
jgi:type II secretory pathway component PulF